jgi:hypothetical protein
MLELDMSCFYSPWEMGMASWEIMLILAAYILPKFIELVASESVSVRGHLVVPAALASPICPKQHNFAGFARLAWRFDQIIEG